MRVSCGERKTLANMLRIITPDGEKKKRTSHKVGWCSVCGWVHGLVKPHTFIENGQTVVKTLCVTCRGKDRAEQRMVLCAVCGLVRGETLYPVAIETLTFDDNGSCNMFLPLCHTCRQKPHSQIRQEIKIPDMCDTCEERYVCYTSQHGQPMDSHKAGYRKSLDTFHKNVRSVMR